MPATTLVKIDTWGLLVSDMHYHNLYRLSASLQLTDSLHVSGGIVDMERQGQGWAVCNIGLLSPNNGKSGSLQRIHTGPEGKWQPDSMALFGHLARPVQATAVDLNGDGRTDWLVCEFGNMTGALSWLENKGDSGFERHII